MSEETNTAGGQPDLAGGEKQEGKDDKQVAYSSFTKAVDEAKAAKIRAHDSEARAKELEEKLEQSRLGDMQKEGKKDEVIRELQNKVSELSKSNQSKDDVYGWTLVESRLKEEAIRNGCKNPDHFVKLLDKSELASIRVSDNYQVDLDSVKGVVERSKGSMDYLFGKPAPKFDTVTPNTNAGTADKKDFSKMTTEELKNAYVTT